MRNPFKRESLDDLEFYDEEDDYYEPQIIESYTEEEYNENEDNKKKYKKYKKIINIIFTIIILFLVMITVDIIIVSRYNIGPFFAIKTSTLKDGGTKVYYGLGYKVIKYNQEQGRRDIEIGYWNLKYNTNPIDTTDLDLAIEFENDYQETNKKYYKKFVRLSSTVKKVDKKNNKLILEYLDEDKKYTLDIICYMAEKESNVDIFNIGDTANIIGTINSFKIKTDKENNKVYINDCFAESEVTAEIVDYED